MSNAQKRFILAIICVLGGVGSYYLFTTKPTKSFDQVFERYSISRNHFERRELFGDLVRTAKTAEDIGNVLFVSEYFLDQPSREILTAKMIDALKAEEIQNGFPEPIVDNAIGPILNAKPRGQVYFEAMKFIDRTVYTIDDYVVLKNRLQANEQAMKMVAVKNPLFRDALYPYSDEEYSLILEDIQKLIAKRMEAP